LGKTAAETVMMLKKSFKDKARGITQVYTYEWFHHFQGREMSVEDQPHCGHPSMSRTDQHVEKFARLSLQIVTGPLTKFLI
jgi:hypothetical protein